MDIKKIENLISRAIKELPYELVNIEVKVGKVILVRIYIDKSGGVNVEDCAITSRLVEKVLDKSDLLPAFYTLEVSSPGISNFDKKGRVKN